MFGSVYYFLAIVTVGIAVPGGVFIPTILAGTFRSAFHFIPCSKACFSSTKLMRLLTGSCVGRIWGRIIQLFIPAHFEVNLGVYALIGASSMLGSVSQMTMYLHSFVTTLALWSLFLLPYWSFLLIFLRTYSCLCVPCNTYLAVFPLFCHSSLQFVNFSFPNPNTHTHTQTFPIPYSLFPIPYSLVHCCYLGNFLMTYVWD